MATRRERADLPRLLRVRSGRRHGLLDDAASSTHGWQRPEAESVTAETLQRLHDMQAKLYADRRYALLVVLQAIDGGGKDSTIRRVCGAFNPQGCTVTSFKEPSQEELAHDFLWRVHAHVPACGHIAVFNRSHYEDVLVPQAEKTLPHDVIQKRYQHINDFERMLVDSGTRVVKIFLHISRHEQRLRLEERLAMPEKHWKFSVSDIEKRRRWRAYREAYELALARCSSQHAPWYLVPADRKWFRDLAVAEILAAELSALPLRWPSLDAAARDSLKLLK
jgi:PPK2 family polyphosphate:nucleotide phosphotransferase